MAIKDICNIGNYYNLDNISVYIYGVTNPLFLNQYNQCINSQLSFIKYLKWLSF